MHERVVEMKWYARTLGQAYVEAQAWMDKCEWRDLPETPVDEIWPDYGLINFVLEHWRGVDAIVDSDHV